ncbi:MAG: hypothetical protein H6737_07490 [Alphaproteobacteria bacterium]|nr:hypothetical protein [Alphaproteobacteria bacterium]
MLRSFAILIPFLLTGCDLFAGRSAGTDPTPVEVEAPEEGEVGATGARRGGDPNMVGHDDAGNRGVRVGGGNGVLIGDQSEVDGVRVGGEYGVMAGDDGHTQGVRIGGDNGVVVGQDDSTQGVRVGGDKGVEVDMKKGVSIGGKKLIGKGK